MSAKRWRRSTRRYARITGCAGSSRVWNWDAGRVSAIASALPVRQRIAVPLGSGVGLRQGEIFGFSPEDIEWTPDGALVHVQRQVRPIGGRLVFRLPKCGKTRTVPLSATLARQITDHAKNHPATPVTLPWGDSNGHKVTVPLLVAPGPGLAWESKNYNPKIWRPAFTTAVLDYRTRIDGMHALRHTFASTMLAGGVTIRELAEYLGHKDPGFTLRVYTHMRPSPHNRARAAIDDFTALLTANDQLAA